MRTIALYVTETMADWEYAYLTTQITEAETIHPGRFALHLVGDGVAEVRSLGGLPITPVADLADLAGDQNLAALVIPGGNHYHSGHERLLELVPQLLQRGVPIAAICGATFMLARAGFLDDRNHTSNDPAYLQLSGYHGAEKYVTNGAVTDNGITTSSGMKAIAFTAEVMRVVQLYPEPIIHAWENLNSTGEAKFYYELMEATNAWQNA